ncbi:hypothetical protein SD81_035420 [Tolypothrix campylonemoides VB511288]|nr:hypothetical protein SD81_035420 [Tolypothrix campylonemoides VB511288]
MVFSSLPLRLKILTSKFTQSLGLPFRKLLPSTIQGVTDDLKLNIATELLTLLLYQFSVKKALNTYSFTQPLYLARQSPQLWEPEHGAGSSWRFV